MQTRFLYAALGFGSGAAIAWAITADIYEKELKRKTEVFNEALKNERQYITNVYNNPNTSMVDDDHISVGPIDIVSPDQIELPEMDEVEENPIPDGETEEETRDNLQTIINMYTPDSETQAEFVEMATPVPGSENTPPFVISRTDYAMDDEGQHYSKITVNYYPHDRVVLDDDDEAIDSKNVDKIIGWRNLNRFGDESGDPDVVFIRNRRMETDFEVVKDDEGKLPLHISYGMEKEEFYANKAAGTLKLRQEDE